MTSSDVAVSFACGFFGREPLSAEMVDDFRGEFTRGGGSTWSDLAAYGRAKLFNILFAFELNRRLRREGEGGRGGGNRPVVVSHALHTGAVQTRSSSNGVGALFSGVPGLPYVASELLAPILWRSPEQGARTLLFAALSDEPPSMLEGGQYLDAIHRPTPKKKKKAGRREPKKMLVRLPPWLGSGNETRVVVEICRDRWEALAAADEKWSAELFDASLELLRASPAKDVVQNIMAP